MLTAPLEKVSAIYASHPGAGACVAFSDPGEAPARLFASRRAETQIPKQGRQEKADACVAFSDPGEAPARLFASRRADTQNPKHGRQEKRSWVYLLL